MKPNLIAAALVSLALIAPCFAQDETAPAPPPAEEATRERPDFDLSDIRDMLVDRDSPTQRADMRAPTVEERAQQIMGRHMRSCWQTPADLPDPDRLIVTLQFSLNEDGTLRGQPRVVQPRSYMFDRPMRTAVERAIRAVRQCSPYPFTADPMLANRYDVWDEFELAFRAP